MYDFECEGAWSNKAEFHFIISIIILIVMCIYAILYGYARNIIKIIVIVNISLLDGIGCGNSEYTELTAGNETRNT